MSVKTFPAMFQKLVEEKGCTAHDVAVATGISDSCISDWKLGKCKPKLDKLLLICDFFEVNLEYFLGINKE